MASFLPSASKKPRTDELLSLRGRQQQQQAEDQGIVPTFVERPSNTSGGFDEVNQIRQQRTPNLGPGPEPARLRVEYGGPFGAQPGHGHGGGGRYQGASTGKSHTGVDLVTIGNYQFDRSIAGKIQGLVNLGGLRIGSGYRDPARNAAAGGVPNSNHLTGRAVDLSGSSAAMQRGAAWARSNGAREVLIHNAGSGVHLHAAW